MNEQLHSRRLYLLLFSAMTLLILWSFAVPVFEGPDENLHWQYASFLNKNKKLPVFEKGFGEANSPPLYYLFIAPFAGNTETPPLYRNKHGVGPIVSKDGIIHPVGTPVFKNENRDFSRFWRIRSARLFSVFFSIITVLFSYFLGKEATGDIYTGFLTAAFVAFLPQFTFRCSHISNDVLVTTLSAVSSYLCIRIYKRGPSLGIILLTALCSALAFLTKINSMFIPLIAVVVLFVKKENGKSFVRDILVLGFIIILITSPWMIRNEWLYGDLFAVQAMEKTVTTLIKMKALTSAYFLTVFPTLLIKSFIGVFGWMTIFLPLWQYLLYCMIGLLALTGLVYGGVTSRLNKTLLLLMILFPLMSLAITIKINLMFNQPQGRYLFPSLPAIALLMSLGLRALPFMTEKRTGILMGGLFLLNLFILVTELIPFYWPVL